MNKIYRAIYVVDINTLLLSIWQSKVKRQI